MIAQMRMKHSSRAIALIAVAGSMGLASIAIAQEFSSGSDGSDGALDFTGAEPGSVIVFDPYNYDPPLDVDQDGVFHFTTITIPENVTVQLSSTLFGGVPVIWLATGDVVIAGTLDLSGEDGHNWDSGQRRYSIPGPGGFGGGAGEREGFQAEDGLGPGRSRGQSGIIGNGAGHARFGTTSGSGGNFYGSPYGNPFLQPLIGGSGAAGGNDNDSSLGGGGGAGGGAILIASDTAIYVEGVVDVSGGSGGRGEAGSNQFNGGHGGGGSGGAIRLVAPELQGSGELDCRGGNGSLSYPSTGSGSEGYIRVEGRIVSRELRFQPDGMIVPLSPNTPILPEQSPSAVRIVQIDGQAVDVTPGGSILNPDIVLDNPSPVEVVIAASGIPIGTQLTLSIFSVELGEITGISTPLKGTLESSTATATIQFPPTISQMFVRATWTP